MSGNKEISEKTRRFFRLETGEKIKTKIFLDIPDFNEVELREYIEENYNWSREIWNIEYEILTIERTVGGSVYPIVEITVPRFIWTKKRKEYDDSEHWHYMNFVKILLNYEVMKKRES